GIPAPLATIGLQIYNAVHAYKTSHFTSKLIAFLKYPKELDEKTMKEFEKKLGTEKEKFMHEVFNIIDRLESEDKTVILSKVFKYVILGKVTKDNFRVMCHIIDSTSYPDLKYFMDYATQDEIRPLPYGAFN